MKTDARVKYTRMVIQQTFLELLQKKPISKITVTEICEIAGINRATFYKHNMDPYDLLEQFENEAIQGLLSMMEGSSARDAGTIILSILTTMQKNRDIFAKFSSLEGDKGFTFRLAVSCFEKINELTTNDRHPSGISSGMSFSYIAGGTSGIMEYWIRSGMKEAPSVIADKIMQMNHAVSQVL